MPENVVFCKKNQKIFGHVKKKQYLCTRFSKKRTFRMVPRDVNQRSVCGPKSEENQ